MTPDATHGPSPEARFSGCRGYARIAIEDELTRERLARQCGTPSPDGIRYNPKPRNPIPGRFGLDGWPIDAPPLSTWTDTGTCALCRGPLSKGPNGQGRPNKTGICRQCHDRITFRRRAAVIALVAERRKGIGP
jgi:hypothetical protein